MRFNLSLILIGGIAAVSVACGSATTEDASASDDALSSTTCTQKTLKCKSGYEETQVGCLQSHVAGAAPFAKCIKVSTSDECVDTDLTCATGYESTEVGCFQSHVAGAHPFAKCVTAGSEDDAGADASDDACVDALTLTCKTGYEITEDGCLQSHVAGAHPYGRCAKSSDDDAGTDAGADASADASDDFTCEDIFTLSCDSGYEITEVGCLQSHVAGADPYGHCVPTP